MSLDVLEEHVLTTAVLALVAGEDGEVSVSTQVIVLAIDEDAERSEDSFDLHVEDDFVVVEEEVDGGETEDGGGDEGE